MSAWEQTGRVLMLGVALLTPLALHGFLVLWVGIGVCGNDGVARGSAMCERDWIFDVWFCLVAATELAVLIAGSMWVSGRDTAPQMAIAWVATLLVALLPVATFASAGG